MRGQSADPNALALIHGYSSASFIVGPQRVDGSIVLLPRMLLQWKVRRCCGRRSRCSRDGCDGGDPTLIRGPPARAAQARFPHDITVDALQIFLLLQPPIGL